MRRAPSKLLFAMTVGLAASATAAEDAAGEPAWVKGWLKAALPRESSEARHREGYSGRGKLPASWRTESTKPLTLHVVDGETGKPVVGVLLSSWQSRQHAFTGVKGTVGPLAWYVDEKGSAHVTASAPGYATGGAWTEPDDKGDVFLALVKDRRRTVTGTVTLAGKPAAGCPVLLRAVDAEGGARDAREDGDRALGGVSYKVLAPERGGSPDAEARTTTDERGRFAVALESGGKLVLVASIPNAGFAEAAVEDGKPARLVLEPAAGKTVQGVVVDEQGNPIRGVTIQDEPSGAKVKTGADGRFAFKSCADGLYYLDVRVKGKSGAEPESIRAGTYGDQDHARLRIVVR